MADELLDIVDEQGVPTGETVLRSIAHNTGILHRTVHVWITNSEGQVLLQQRSFSKPNGPGEWDIAAGGHIKAGVEPIDGALEEAKEELGLEFVTSQLKLIHMNQLRLQEGDVTNNEVQFAYLIYLDDISQIHFADGEVEQVRWFDLDELSCELSDSNSKFKFSSYGAYWTDMIFKLRNL
jgi:isopentenyldiphosphate isomerase